MSSNSPSPSSDEPDASSEISLEQKAYRILGPERFRRFHEREVHDRSTVVKLRFPLEPTNPQSDSSNHETGFHTRHGDRHSSSIELEDGLTLPIEVVLDVARLRYQYSDEYRTLMVAMADTTQRVILACLLEKGGVVTYEEIANWTSATKRTVKNHVYKLRDRGILEIQEGRPSTISFRNSDLRLLASDVLSFTT
jgi:DNA-binding transcriptional ArsR family regulator